MSASGSGQMYIPQMSTSCPPEMKDEKMRGGCPPFGMNPSMMNVVRNLCISVHYAAILSNFKLSD